MFVLFADKTRLSIRQCEPLTSGSVNVYRCRFEFSPDWEGLEKIACFRSGSQTVTVLLDDSGECTIPWEVTDPDDKNKRLYAGIYGTSNGTTVLPTVWENLGVIQEGVNGWAPARPPTPDLYDRILAVLTQKQDKLTGRPGQVVGFNENGDAVATEAITGLEEALERIPVPMTAAQLQTILYGGKEHE